MKKLALAFLVTASVPAMAGVSVSPVYLDLASQQKIETMRIKNTGSQPLHMQAGAFRWTQVNGENREEPTQDIKVAPAMFVIPAGGEQRVRVIRTTPDQAQEIQYRVVMAELPSPNYQASECNPVVGELQKQATYLPNSSCAEKTAQSAVNLMFSHKFSVIYRPQGSEPKLHVERVPGALKITNKGNATARFGRLVDTRGETGYVLPGSTMLFPVQKQGPVQVLLNGKETTL